MSEYYHRYRGNVITIKPQSLTQGEVGRPRLTPLTAPSSSLLQVPARLNPLTLKRVSLRLMSHKVKDLSSGSERNGGGGGGITRRLAQPLAVSQRTSELCVDRLIVSSLPVTQK